MSKDWKITGKEGGGVDVLGTTASLASGFGILDMLTGGDGAIHKPTTYTVENTRSGETKTVTAYSRDGAGQKIARGDFDKK